MIRQHLRRFRTQSGIIAVDIGGTNTKVGLMQEGSLIKRVSFSTRSCRTPKALVQRIAHKAAGLQAGTGVGLRGAGIGCPGVIDHKTGMVMISPNLTMLNGYPLRRELESILGLPVAVQNDANAAALGEYLFGCKRRVANLVVLTLGTGVGGGIIADGRLLYGADGAAAELGHLCIHTDGEICGCGKRGCLEAYVGMAGIAKIARSLWPGVKRLNTAAIHTAAIAGNNTAKEILRRVGEYLGRGMALMIDVLNPEKIVLSGGASAALSFFLPGIATALRSHCAFAPTRDRTLIERSAVPDDIGLMGPAAAFLYTGVAHEVA